MQVNTLILGAGAAGMMCAAQAGPSVLVIDHAKAPGEKIRISGGGRCNFTNMHTDPARFLGQNPHFHKSALSRYTQWDFLDLVDRHKIAWHEKTLGQLFCDDKATLIIEMLRAEMAKIGAELWLQTSLIDLNHDGSRFRAELERDGKRISVFARNLVLATGGKSIPKMGATGIAYEIARQFGHAITDTRPALVPLTFSDQRFAPISGVSTPVIAQANGTAFEEALLFTHRGLSGPAVLQISSYWKEGDAIEVNLVPEHDLSSTLKAARQTHGKRNVTTALADVLPERLVVHLSADLPLGGNLGDLSDKRIDEISDRLQHWSLTPSGSEGYRTAEVTLGGISTDRIDSKTMMSRDVRGLYMIGEAVDVTGWLGGYNFQWAWSSGVAAGRAIAKQG
ncbi:NAD(P)/FAD-dependent oxidoreductase [Marivita sp. XM-24bin2]|uniref:NAD(P)/FAD-dependent oxidoreductase n=1 Tax=unclassified Marivita TaxID=2632480 RepID=UPI000D78FE80|nr:NAD(P)/FAD-dependent oxidoreductase [Marivita sp. XM-24bin2]PWL33720.1 MAG: aminoacetone oxidase family FAD-binding enzyme [Marivita sp. XM-24bin2]